MKKLRRMSAHKKTDMPITKAKHRQLIAVVLPCAAILALSIGGFWVPQPVLARQEALSLPLEESAKTDEAIDNDNTEELPTSLNSPAASTDVTVQDDAHAHPLPSKTYDVIEDAPSWVYDLIRLETKNGELKEPKILDAKNPTLWINKENKQTTFSHKASLDFELEFSVDYKLDDLGNFATPAPPSGIPAASCSHFFVKQKNSTTVYRVNVQHDYTAPKIDGKQRLVDGIDGVTLDLEKQWIDTNKKMLTMGASGLKIGILPRDSSTEGEDVSGLSADTHERAVLEYVTPDGNKKTLKPSEVTREEFVSFTLGAKELKNWGETTLDLTKVSVVVSDQAGNIQRETLSELPMIKASGITKLRIKDSKVDRTKLSIDFGSEVKQVNGKNLTNAHAIIPTLTLKDSLFKELIKDPAWVDAHPLTYKLDGGETKVLDPAKLTAINGTSDEYALKLDPIDAEGTHTIEVAYAGADALAHQPLGTGFGQNIKSELIIDRTKPRVVSAEIIGGFKKSDIAAVSEASSFLMGGTRRIAINFTDTGSDGDAVDTGIASVEVLSVKRSSPTASSGSSNSQTFTSVQDSVQINLDSEGCYLLTEIRVVLTDNADNSSTITLNAVPNVHDWGFEGFVVIDSTQSSTRVDLIDASGYGNSDPVYGDFYPADCIPTAIIRNQYFYLISKTSAFSHALNASFEDVSGKKDIPVDMTKFTQMGIPGLYSLPIPYTRTDGKLSDGHYSVSFDLGYWHHLKSTEFNIDTTAPQLSGAEIEGGVPASEVATLSESKKILAGGERTLRLRLQDLLPRASGQNPEVSSRDETFTSTLDEQKSTISISIARSLNDENPQFDTKSIAELKRSSDGYVDLQLKESGLYKLHDIKIVLYDKCGNSCTVDLGTYAGEHDWGIDSILVDNQTTKPKTQLSLENAPNTPKTKDLKIRRGTVILRATVTDPWFEVYQVLFGAEPILKIRYTALDGTSHELEPKSVSQFVPGGGHIVLTAYSYVYTYDLPRNMDDTQDPKRPREGSYEVSLEYVGIARHQKGQTFLSNNEVHEEVSSDKQLVTSDSKLEFAIDYTAPKLGHLEMSEVKPVPRYRSGKHKDEPWGWIFAKQEEKVTLQVSDNLAGLQEGTLHINKGSSTAEVESNFRGGLSVLAGEVAFSFKGDGSRLYLDETTITIEDKAGNVASTGALSQYADSNRPAGVHSIAIDESAPKIELSFADNDAHNGKYYNHARKMVVSVNEANFDLIQKYAPDTLIESAKRDGSGSFVQSLKAEDFKATHDADGKKIYVAHAVFEDDADWDVEAFFYDGAGRASNKATASFVIDTQAPSLLVTYDNNEVANGMYYKAPRTATITVHDRNFASELGNIRARTLSGGPAPSVSSWSEIKQREEWRAQVSFAGETHYQLGVTVSDLAGNTAESYDSGEFVIDMTAPKLEITGVEPQHAYSGDVVPSVVYSDTNLDVLGSTYTVTGARQGNSYFPNTSERESSTEKQVSLGNIPYELQYDDVYSFDAKAIDLAGNIAQKTIAYSVNRFGSTYFFADNSKNVHGSYLPHPQDVQIIEVNVSGLDTSQSRVELSQDSESCLLEMNKDYAIDPNAPDRGWSATTYTLPAQLFKQDGFYRITLTSKDAAGLLSQNTMEGKDSNHNGSFPVSFAVDQTKPLANLIGVTSGATYLDPNKTALVDAYDNIELRKLEFYIDGKLVTSWKDKELQSGDPKSVVLKIDGKPHDYRVVSQDAAGNSSDTIYSNVVITSDWFVYILRTPHLLVKAVGGVVIVVGLVALIAYLVWRAYKAGEQQRNPFGH